MRQRAEPVKWQNDIDRWRYRLQFTCLRPHKTGRFRTFVLQKKLYASKSTTYTNQEYKSTIFSKATPIHCPGWCKHGAITVQRQCNHGAKECNIGATTVQKSAKHCTANHIITVRTFPSATSSAVPGRINQSRNLHSINTAYGYAAQNGTKRNDFPENGTPPRCNDSATMVQNLAHLPLMKAQQNGLPSFPSAIASRRWKL